MQRVVALFGESEKGHWGKPHLIRRLPELIDFLGHPPLESEGLFFAVQSLLYEREVLYFRVQEEGFSVPDYLLGFHILKNKEKFQNLHALCMPGVGDREILDASQRLCWHHKAHMIITEKDLYDYLTH